MKKQIWFCDTCCVRGFVEYDESSDVYSVARLVRASHRQNSPGCIKDPRILNPNHPETKEVEEMISVF